MRKAQLICMEPGCTTCGPPAATMPEAKVLADAEGWQVGKRGASRIPGWEDDFCPEHALLHPRICCDGDRKPCLHRSVYTLIRDKDGTTVQACGSHLTVLTHQLVAGGHEIRTKETPV